MKRINLLILPLLTGLAACLSSSSENKVENWKKEVMETERVFAKMAKEQGVPAAFEAFAADSVVLMRNNQLITGKKAMADSYRHSVLDDPNISLEWEPDFVDVAGSGDLAYTYGTYIFSIVDSMGVTKRDTGIFHTVWKRQSNGQWRFVWD